ncbi:hypothetical protein E2C01_072194 [Portunus trituberculatus]|uniref:Uncharacterized protein n=1 Tax=Portunus trituberculatus TaxID=210409 RepID=A0A5B7HZ95_PORTR|nr:hypothetical protein [Portunus trituberculatus]
MQVAALHHHRSARRGHPPTPSLDGTVARLSRNGFIVTPSGIRTLTGPHRFLGERRTRSLSQQKACKDWVLCEASRVVNLSPT